MVEHPTGPTAHGLVRPTRRTVLKSIGVATTAPGLAGVAAAKETRTVVDFAADGPENLAVDAGGDVYMTMNFSGEIRRLRADDVGRRGLGPDDTDLVATLDPGAGFITGIVEHHGTLFVNLASFGSGDAHGVWRIPPNGSPALLAPMAPTVLPNGLLHDHDHDHDRHRLLVTDSFGGQVLSVDLPGGAVTTWVDDGRLDPATFIGANGIDVDADGDVYVANLDHGRVVRVPMLADGTAGSPETVVEDPRLVGADGLTFHRGRRLYVAVNGQDAVVRVAPSGRLHTVVDADDGLDFPADVAFGTAGRTAGALWVANFAFDPGTGTIAGDPSLVLAHP